MCIRDSLGSQVEKAFSYEEQVRPYLEEIRDHIDHLELEIDDEDVYKRQVTHY